MKLEDFLAALKNNTAVITVKDEDDNELIKLFAPGYSQLVTSLLERVVDEVVIQNLQSIIVKLAED